MSKEWKIYELGLPMKNETKLLHQLTIFFLAVLILLGTTKRELRASEFREDFSAAAEQTELKVVDGWSVHYGKEGAAKVELAAGYTGAGARIELAEQYRRLIPADQALSVEEGASGEFRIKLRIMAPNDSYAIIQVLIGFNDGTHGLAVRFDGGARDGGGDNFIRISRGGESWGRISFEDIKTASWKKETWYEIVLSDLGKKPGALDISGKVTVRQVDDPADVLVKEASITSFGGKGKFPSINVIVVGVGGPAKAFDFDDLSLKSMEK